MPSNSQVCHDWAQQNSASGKGSNLYYDGRIIYSYGAHYKLGMIHGQTALINSSGYSVTTGKHTGYAKSAVSHYNVIDCPLVDPNGSADHKTNLAFFKESIEHNVKKAIRARLHAGMYEESAGLFAQNYNNYIELFNIKRKPIDPAGLFTDAERARLKKVMKAETDAQRARNLAREKELTAKIDGWKAGAGYYDYSFNARPVCLRLYADSVETSHGASCQLKDALILVKVLLAGKDPAGVSFGQYTARRWDGDILIIGCHKIPRAEVLRMCKLIKEGT